VHSSVIFFVLVSEFRRRSPVLCPFPRESPRRFCNTFGSASFFFFRLVPVFEPHRRWLLVLFSVGAGIGGFSSLDPHPCCGSRFAYDPSFPVVGGTFDPCLTPFLSFSSYPLWFVAFRFSKFDLGRAPSFFSGASFLCNCFSTLFFFCTGHQFFCCSCVSHPVFPDIERLFFFFFFFSRPSFSFFLSRRHLTLLFPSAKMSVWRSGNYSEEPGDSPLPRSFERPSFSQGLPFFRKASLGPTFSRMEQFSPSNLLSALTRIYGTFLFRCLRLPFFSPDRWFRSPRCFYFVDLGFLFPGFRGSSAGLRVPSHFCLPLTLTFCGLPPFFF